MSEQNSPSGISRRNALKKTGLALTAGVPSISLLSGTAAADYPYDTTESGDGYQSIRYTKNSLYHNYVKFSLSSTVHHLLSARASDGRWTHKFGLNSQAVSVFTREDELQANIGHQHANLEKMGDSSMEITGKPVGSDYVGAMPDSGNNSDVGDFFLTAAQTTASLLSKKFAYASAAYTILSALAKMGNEDCSSRTDCHLYDWDHDQAGEVGHQAKFYADIDEDDWGNIEVTTAIEEEVGVSFVLTIGNGQHFEYAYEPPSRSDMIRAHGTGGSSGGNTFGGYLSRDQAKDLARAAEKGGSGLSAPSEMTAAEKQQYGVRELDEPKLVQAAGEERRITHIATNVPFTTYALEPPEQFR